MESSQPSRIFEFHEILSATNNFDESLVIGKGGFGKVYKGLIVSGPSHEVAAIKRLDPMSGQGAAEFWAEVEMLSKLRHSHIVSLLGYCFHEREMILIYEYMPKGTLDDHLHKLGTSLSWERRLQICIGAARALEYLHTGTGIRSRIIHRDVKSANILLDDSWAAKISDFGLSKIGPTNQPNTHVNTLVRGTFGYLDPSYFATGQLTRRSDVYAFGVVLLEVLCRKRAVDSSLDEEQWGLVPWFEDSIKKGKLKDTIDSDIRDQISTRCLKEFVKIAKRCLLYNPKERPMMSEVVVSLESILNNSQQEKTDSSLHAQGKTMFGRMLDMIPLSANGDSSAPGPLKLSSKDKSRNDRSRKAAGYIVGPDNSRNTSLKVLKFADLKRATRHFSEDLLLDKDAFGEVYLGWVDKNTFVASTEGVGIAVAVKMYGEDQPQWQTVVTILGRLAHPNIISLLGYCDDKKHKCLLVKEYMQNRNFGHFLFGDARYVVEPLLWERRLMIMIGVARGLTYMHSLKDQVIHRDVKTSNILLDKDFNAKLGGFEVAKIGAEIGEVNVTTCIMGTFGYMDPAYARNGHMTVKSDIYSFGVVLLEALTGQRALERNPPYDFFLVEWASSVLADRSKLKEIIDPRLGPNYPLEGASECAALALRCVALDHKDRPSSGEVLMILERIYASKNSVQRYV